MIISRKPVVVARSYTFPAPVGGWNAADALDAMPREDAETMINWFPETTFARLRSGFSSFCDTGTGLSIKTLAEYGGTASKLLAASDGEVWDVTSGTAASLASGFTSDIWDTTNFATAAGQYMLMANGADTPQVYNGTTLVAAVNTIGGVAPAIDFSQVESFNNRIFYAEADSLSVWYLPVGQFQGALTEFDFGGLCERGGTISKIATWTRDNAASGANEMFVIVTTKGEVLIYLGPDPATWSLSARFLVGEPVSGPNSVVRLGPDCVLLCEDGFQPLAQYLQLGESKAQAIALSRKIGNAVTEAVRLKKAEEGWGATLYPQGNMLVFNVPQGGGVFYQYVINTITGSWCQFQGMNGQSWSLYNGELYFGGYDGVVYKANTGTSDNGGAITGDLRQAWQMPGNRAQNKRVTMGRPIFRTNGPVYTSFGIDVDYVASMLPAPSLSYSVGALWGTAVWGVDAWGGGYQLQRDWISVTGIGYALAPHMKVQTGTITLQLMSIDILYEAGGFV
jgi:hypothetical protein